MVNIGLKIISYELFRENILCTKLALVSKLFCDDKLSYVLVYTVNVAKYNRGETCYTLQPICSRRCWDHPSV